MDKLKLLLAHAKTATVRRMCGVFDRYGASAADLAAKSRHAQLARVLRLFVRPPQAAGSLGRIADDATSATAAAGGGGGDETPNDLGFMSPEAPGTPRSPRDAANGGSVPATAGPSARGSRAGTSSQPGVAVNGNPWPKRFVLDVTQQDGETRKPAISPHSAVVMGRKQVAQAALSRTGTLSTAASTRKAGRNSMSGDMVRKSLLTMAAEYDE
jgi:hypothetical protein